MKAIHIAGIDFGSKLAGTTCVCYAEGNRLRVVQSQKKADADEFLMHHLGSRPFALAGIDAPLSLPRVYSGVGDDYFFRQADRQLKAMSPMFLGGLTARAMRLRHLLQQQGVNVIECYPAALVDQTETLQHTYKKDLAGFHQSVATWLQAFQVPAFANWHQADSVLAWISAWRYSRGLHLSVGHAEEGVIIV
ncbi:MAG: DUF429 domain-containing protein [Bacteroidota bacterium]